jgi:hypothetical protein
MLRVYTLKITIRTINTDETDSLHVTKASFYTYSEYSFGTAGT